jgi:hypothetical protein
MARPLVSDQTPEEYFKELVEEALSRQHLQAADLTEYYLVNLLCQYARPDLSGEQAECGEPLALRLGRALHSPGADQRARLRRLGDFSLFTSGFFSDSLRCSVVDVDYYKSMGEYAYASLSRSDRDAFADVFGELSRKFVGFMDVLAYISERTSSGSPSGPDLLRLYEKWLRTGSVRDGQRLARRGLVPNASIGKRFMQ